MVNVFETEKVVMINPEDAPYAPAAQLGEYVVHRWNWKEKQEATKNATTVIDARRGLVTTDIVVYELSMLLACVKKAPFEKSLESFSALDPQVGDILAQACRDVNGLTVSEQANLSDQSEVTKAIPG